MQRFVGTFVQVYLGFPKGFFEERCLDSGCGNTVKLLGALYHMGADDLCGSDLGEAWIEGAGGSLLQHDVPADAFDLRGGSVLDIPHEPETFDFVSCDGVLVHLNDKEKAATWSAWR